MLNRMNSILVVDDERNYLLVLEALLSEEGYQVITAEGARRGIELLQENDLDVVLTDMKMPGMDGMEFMERIRQRQADLPVIMMTAFGSVEKAVEAMRKGAFDYIVKPFKNEELKLTIAKAINHYHLVRQIGAVCPRTARQVSLRKHHRQKRRKCSAYSS